jgi:hypothetical protein
MSHVNYSISIGGYYVSVEADNFGEHPIEVTVNNEDNRVNIKMRDHDQLRKLANTLNACADWYEANKDED